MNREFQKTYKVEHYNQVLLRWEEKQEFDDLDEARNYCKWHIKARPSPQHLRILQVVSEFRTEPIWEREESTGEDTE